MRRFRIYKDPKWGSDDVSWAHEAVKLGFSWPGLLIGPFWALAKGLWRFAAVLFALAIVSRIVEQMAEANYSHALVMVGIIADVIWLGLLVVTGFLGNEWRVSKLEREGYDLVATVEAKSAKEALAPYQVANEKA